MIIQKLNILKHKLHLILRNSAFVLLFTILSISIVFGAEHHTSWDGFCPYEIVNDNKPYFTQEELNIKSFFISLSELDKLGRTGQSMMCIDYNHLPTEERGDIGNIRPSGWMYNGKSNNNKYDNVDGKYIYNRCHQLGYQFSGLNSEPQNLFTGTRYINIEGMLPFENDVTEYVKQTHNHVLYRCTPIFEGNNLICEGVRIEGYSVEDQGQDICFNVFCYNVQPGVSIDYANGLNQSSNDYYKYKTQFDSKNSLDNNIEEEPKDIVCEVIDSIPDKYKYNVRYWRKNK